VSLVLSLVNPIAAVVVVQMSQRVGQIGFATNERVLTVPLPGNARGRGATEAFVLADVCESSAMFCHRRLDPVPVAYRIGRHITRTEDGGGGGQKEEKGKTNSMYSSLNRSRRARFFARITIRGEYQKQNHDESDEGAGEWTKTGQQTDRLGCDGRRHNRRRRRFLGRW